nr:matrix protein 2-2 [Avian metapneumovirus]
MLITRITLPCRRITVVIKCQVHGYCLLQCCSDALTMYRSELIDAIARMVYYNHIDLCRCAACRVHVEFISICTSTS